MELPDEMIFSSPAFDYGEVMPERFTTAGQNIAPPLVIANAPPETEGVVIVFDAPTIRTGDRAQVRWLVWGLPPEDTELDAGELPEDAVRGQTDLGTRDYQGPSSDTSESYRFRAFAVDRELDCEPGASPETVFEAIEEHICATGLIELFSS